MSNKYMIIDERIVNIEGEKSILELVRKAGIDLPTLCYFSDLSRYGACRMCIVEDERGGLVHSCATPPKHGMKITTNSAKLTKHRRMILELILASHCRECTSCEKSGHCKLQSLAERYGITKVRFEDYREDCVVDTSSPSIVRDNSKCILCGGCVRMCSEIQNVGAIDLAFRGSETFVTPEYGKELATTKCVNCGQCAAVCPTGAIVVKNDTEQVWNYLNDPKYHVIAQVAPAVRVAIGEEFGIEVGQSAMNLIVAALRRLGFDEVQDTSFTADLTIMEETAEFLDRFTKGENLPLFTSCCPAWMRYVELNHPELLPNISTCRSPQGMFGSVVKESVRLNPRTDGKTTVICSVMPCTAKKFEAKRPELGKDGVPDIDVVITTQELARMIKQSGIAFADLQPEAADMPYGVVSGAGKIFGVTGGVTEAVIRRVVEDKSSTTLHNIAYTGVRGMEGIKEFTVPVGEAEVRVAVVSGLANAEALIQKLQSGEAKYDIIEVMACPGGCVSGGGQPISGKEEKCLRTEGLYADDTSSELRRSQDNYALDKIYSEIIRGRNHELLHTHHVH